MMSLWQAIFYGVGMILFVFTGVKEIRRIPTKNRILRILALLLCFFSILALLVPIPWPFSQTNWSSNKEDSKTTAVLLTPGFKLASLLSKKEWKKNDSLFYKTFTLDEDIHLAYPQVRFIHDFPNLIHDFPEIETLHIVGYGLEKNQVRRFESLPKNVKIDYSAPEPPLGIIACHWLRHNNRGDQLLVQGKIYNTSKYPLRIQLIGQGKNLDSVQVSKKGVSLFELNTILTTEGNNLFHILVLKNQDTIQYEPIPVCINKINPLKIWILSSSPNFENRFLEAWLHKKSFQVIKSSQISTEKFSQHYTLNARLKQSLKSSINPIQSSFVNDLDVIITDQQAITLLSSHEATILKEAVENGGLGLIIRTDSTIKKNWFSAGFTTRASTIQPNKMMGIHSPLLPGRNDGKTKPIEVPPYFLESEGRSSSIPQSLYFDSVKHLLVGVRLQGLGKIILSTLSKTFSWTLKGNDSDYDFFWGSLISTVARKRTLSPEVVSEVEIPKIRTEIKVQFSSKRTLTPQFSGLVSTHEKNSTLPFLQSFTFWADRTGWQYLHKSSEMTVPLYIFKSKDWLNLEYMNRTSQTVQLTPSANFPPENPPSRFSKKNGLKAVASEIPKIYFYFLFSIASFYLWMEAKFI